MERIVLAAPADTARVTDLVYSLQGKYPFLRMQVLGKSVVGRKIYALTLGDMENAVLYAGGFHALEWITSLVLLRFCEQLCRAVGENRTLSGIDVRKALKGRGIVVVPQVNPDGVEIVLNGAGSAGALAESVDRIAGGDYSAWQANANGVDINHNFDAGWHLLREMEEREGICGPAVRQFGGSGPESEPETQALADLCRGTAFRHVLALHTQGEEIYWRYGERTPPRARLMAKILGASSGYAVADPEGLASHGGFKDWFIQAYERPGFTIEMGRGENPLPLSGFDMMYHRALEMLTIAAIM